MDDSITILTFRGEWLILLLFWKEFINEQIKKMNNFPAYKVLKYEPDKNIDSFIFSNVYNIYLICL